MSNTIFRNFYRQWVFDLVNQATSPIQLLQKGNRVLSRCDRLGGIGSIEQLGGRRESWSPALKPFPRNPPAVRSRLGLAWHCVRRGRAGVGAGQDCTELAAELFEPLVFFPHLQHPLLDCVLLHACIDRWMPTCCSMAVATAAAMQGIPACCGRSTEAAPRRSTWV